MPPPPAPARGEPAILVDAIGGFNPVEDLVSEGDIVSIRVCLAIAQPLGCNKYSGHITGKVAQPVESAVTPVVPNPKLVRDTLAS